MKLVRVFLGLFFIFQPLACVFANGTEYPALLGNGYDALKLEHKMNRCISGTVSEIPAIEIVTEIKKVTDWNELQSQMNFKIPGSLVLNSDSELAKFVLRARDTQFTSTYHLHHHIGAKQKMLTDPVLSNTETDAKNFREECGTQYIGIVTTGGKLDVGVKFSFSNFEFKQEFDAGGAMSSLTGLSVHVGALTELAKKNSSVEIFFHQTGGKLSDLTNMFESKDIVSCSLEHFDRCESLLEAILNYSKGSFAKAVMEEGKDQTISFQTHDYPHAPQIYESPVVKNERLKILDILEQQYLDHDYLISLKGHMDAYENCDDRCLKTLLSHVMANMRILKESITLSFADPERFLELGTLSKLELHAVELPMKRPPSYYEFITRNAQYLLPSTMVVVVVPLIYYFTMKRMSGAAIGT